MHLKAAELKTIDELSEAMLTILLKKWNDLDNLLNKITAEQAAESDRPKSGPPG